MNVEIREKEMKEVIEKVFRPLLNNFFQTLGDAMPEKFNMSEYMTVSSSLVTGIVIRSHMKFFDLCIEEMNLPPNEVAKVVRAAFKPFHEHLLIAFDNVLAEYIKNSVSVSHDKVY